MNWRGVARLKAENLKLAYAEANANRRHYSGLRFAVNGVFFAVLGGIVSVAFEVIEIKSPSPARIVIGARVAGLCFTIIFFWFEIMCDLHIRHFARVIECFENELGYRQLSNRDFRRYLPRTFYFSWSPYVVLIILWIFSIVWKLVWITA